MVARFVQLGITGFKSFADPISLALLPGLTGIVGPNGCGKSNVVEALRWAMGEGNARTLRGGEMDDVIFAGTSHRPSRNLAEVSLTIEADGAELPPPFAARPELSVTRRIERGCGSVYRVNGREARARDVQTLFADMGSGARSSAMVNQGRVAAVVSARPEERRAVLEEAAGITGLHARRAEAETRLRATEANLERAEERRALLEKQIDGLQAQAKQAARYRTVTEAAAETEALLLAIGRARADRTRREAAEAVRAGRAAAEQAVEAAGQLRAAASEAQAQVPALREAVAQARSRWERARIAEENVAAETERAVAALQAATQRRDQAARDLQHVRSGLGDAAAAEGRLASELTRIEGEEAAYPAALELASDEAGAVAEALRAADAALADARAQAAETAAKAGALRQTVEQATGRLQRAAQALAALNKERDRLLTEAIDPARLADAAAALSAAEQALTAARSGFEATEASYEAATAAARLAREAHAEIDAAFRRIAAGEAALQDILAIGEGEAWTPMVDLLDVTAGLETALGSVLGEELGASDDPGAGRHWRALPPVAFPSGPGRPLAAGVSGPAQMARALAGILLVEDEAEGEASQAGLHPGQCLVSRDGAMWRWDGYTVKAGTPTAAAVRLQQRNRLVQLRAQLVSAGSELEVAQGRRAEAERLERETLTALQAARTGLRTAETEAERARKAMAGLQTQADRTSSRLEVVDRQLAYAVPEHESGLAAAEAARREQAGLPDADLLRRTVEDHRKSVDTARAREVECTRRLDEIRRAAATRQARRDGIGREGGEVRRRAADLSDRAAELLAREEETGAEVARLADAPVQAAARAVEARQTVATSRTEHEAAAGALSTAEAQAAEQASAAHGAEHAAFACRENLARAETGASAADDAWAAAVARVAEREGALPPLPHISPDTLEAEDRARSRLARLVRERDDMGPVNLRAEMEAAAVLAEVRTIESERDELGHAIAKLRGVIGHLNREGREQVAAVFQQVDRHFQALFARMFGGGRAHLALVGSDDPLQAGLEIYAQPPGKKLAVLSLLSGGEQALTALCLIFAISRCNPAPLCVLDEVDAPLDDANVGRFCDLLREIGDQTQTRFLVVTHHQLTMARMDRLFGVTMQERGVSRLLSVDLGVAAQMVEAVAAE